MLRNMWGGVGWDVMTGVALEHMGDATQHGVGCDDSCCTGAHGPCYAARGVRSGWM